MLPRPKSIFNIGGEGGEEEEEEVEAISNVTLASTGGIVNVITRGGAGGGRELVAGLRVAIQHHGRGTNVVTKSTLKSSSSSSSSCRSSSGYRPRRCPPKSLPEFGFLKTCMFCMRELRLEMEVYMYRGDQGFCSVECRYQQILIDERSESDTSKRAVRRATHSTCCSSPTSDHRRRKISAAA